MTERIREIIFAHHLILGGGDGAAPNLEAWRLMKLVSNGNKHHTILRNALRAADMPFFGGSDLKEHNIKHLWNQVKRVDFPPKGSVFRLDRTIVHLRGVVPKSIGSSEMRLAAKGCISHSSYEGRPLATILGGVPKAKEWRQKNRQLGLGAR